MASTNSREVVEGVQQQGVDEEIRWSINWAAWGIPSSPVVVVKTGADDVTATVMPTNSPIVSGTEVILSPLLNLTAGLLYRIEVLATVGGNVLENYFYVIGQE